MPLICGAMYPCSNPELVAAVSEAGGIGIVQPISLTYVHGHDFREGLRLIRRLTAKPIGMNALIEQSSSTYRERMERWVDIALEEGVRFFVTSLGNPRWVVERVARGGRRRLPRRHRAQVGREGPWTRGVDGLIAVNGRAGGHAGREIRRGAVRRARGLRAAGGLRRRASARARLRRARSRSATPACRWARASSPPRVPRQRRPTSRRSSPPARRTSCSPSASPACRSR